MNKLRQLFLFLIIFIVFLGFSPFLLKAQAADHTIQNYDSPYAIFNRTFKVDQQGNVWFVGGEYVNGIWNLYIAKLDLLTGTFARKVMNFTHYDTYFDIDSQGNVWTAVSTWSPRSLIFVKINPETQERTEYPVSFPGGGYGLWISNVIVDKNDVVWVVNNNPSPDGDAKRCYLGYNPQTGYIGYFKMPFVTNIWGEKKDTNGDIWSGTNSNSLFKFNITNHAFQAYTYPSPSNANVRSFDFDSSGQIWMAPYNWSGYNLVKYNPVTNAIVNKPLAFAPYSIAIDKTDAIWLTRYNNSVVNVYENNAITKSYNLSPYAAFYVNKSLDSSIWASTSTGNNYRFTRFLSDINPPQTTVAITGTQGDNNWYISDVQTTLSASDENSGVASTYYSFDNNTWIEYTTPFVISDEGATNLYFYSVDNAGNTEDAQEEIIRIDKTAPEIVISSPIQGGEYQVNEPLTTSWTAEDTLSGILSAVGTTPSENAIDTATIGEKTFQVVAKDKAGNEKEISFSYFVRYAFSGLLSPLKSNEDNLFKKGRTIPVKFTLAGYTGANINTASARLFLEDITGKRYEAVSAGKANEGNNFRYDSEEGNYIFNLDTGTFSAGKWNLIVELDDGSSHTIGITLEENSGKK